MTIEPAGSVPQPSLSERSCRLLAGMDAGIVGGAVAVCWFMFHSWLAGEFWWAKLNVAGALFYGSPVYTMGLSRASLAGGALLITLYAVLGGLFGLVARTRGFTRNLLLGMMFAMAWHVLANRYFWRRLDSFGPAYFPVLATLPAHLIFGLGLSRYSSRFQRLAITFGDSTWASALIEDADSAEPEAPAPSPTPIGPEPSAIAGDLETHSPGEVRPSPDGQSSADLSQIIGVPDAVCPEAADPAHSPVESAPDDALRATAPAEPEPQAHEESTPPSKSDC